MDLNRQHPLQQIAGYNSLSMLEALIPYVDYSLKLPLALFIKFNEINLIVRTFQNREALSQFGLHNASSSPSDLLCSLTGITPEMLQMLLNLSQNGSFPFSPETNFNEKAPPTDFSPPDFSMLSDLIYNQESQPPDDTFDAHIDNLFAQYDMEHSME